MDTKKVLKSRHSQWRERRQASSLTRNNLPDVIQIYDRLADETDLSKDKAKSEDVCLHASLDGGKAEDIQFRNTEYNDNANDASYEAKNIDLRTVVLQAKCLQLLDKTSQVCQHCGGTELEYVKDNHDGVVLGKTCMTCQQFYAVADDTMSAYDIDEWLEKLKAKLCPTCDNCDVNNYNIKSATAITCLKCNTDIVIKINTNLNTLLHRTKCGNEAENARSNSSSGSLDKNEDCDEGNQAQSWYSWLTSPVGYFLPQNTKRMRALKEVKPYISIAGTVARDYLPGSLHILAPQLLYTLLIISGIEVYETVETTKENLRKKKTDGDVKSKENIYGGVLQGITSIGAATGMAFFGQYGGVAAITEYGPQYLILPASVLGGMVGQKLGQALTTYLHGAFDKQN